MNKKIIIAVVLLLLLGAGGYYFMKSGKDGSSSPASESSSKTQSIKELIAENIPQKCTFKTTDETSGTSEGTTYVSGGKVRGDFSVTQEGKTTINHMISDGQVSYIWQDGEKNGFKMTLSAEDAAEIKSDTSTSATAATGADLDQKVDYNCSAWIPDNSMFDPPKDVTFTDFSDMLKPQGSGGTDSKASQCAYCGNLSGDDKTQCLTALGCN
jgi:hypothetical protein